MLCYDTVIALDRTYQRCLKATSVYEKVYELPPGLLHSITIVESGKWNKDHQKMLPHPWTLNVQGKPHYFDSKLEAVKFLKKMIAKGIENIDIGCAQINWKHHGKHNFRSPEDVLNPNFNIAYAAYFLSQNFLETGNWNKAVAIYHSRAERGKVYSAKVRGIWRDNKNDTNRFLFHKKANPDSVIAKSKKNPAKVGKAINTRVKLDAPVASPITSQSNQVHAAIRDKTRDGQRILIFTNEQSNSNAAYNAQPIILP